jgi:hypothetical protein
MDKKTSGCETSGSEQKIQVKENFVDLDDYLGKMKNALEMAESYLCVDGEHHKQYALHQICLILTGNFSEKWKKSYSRNNCCDKYKCKGKCGYAVDMESDEMVGIP